MSSLQFKLVSSNEQIENIVQLGVEIWADHYSPIIGMDQVNYMLNKFQSFNAIQSQIKEGYIYYEMCINNSIIGYLSIQNKTNYLFLSKIYIHKNFRSKGYFRQAFELIVSQAIDNKKNKIQLTVNKYNSNSIEIYKSKGFEIVESTVFDIGNGYIMDDYIMEFTFL